ncbi:hypothetical protein Acsp04_48070 [Actinomadura sp. NBRC 104425]|uniref:helix-turn-helix domain-containing protein n=1 Tax=Actinomadura sp. NBRC 104425 TaxID=3032204 RepID=UPI0024A0B200|nr:hypothetical protein [Actinomadura sp. NBRC 104425]GLZ14572.1 hypothetical protein Acsp04_48070 [Actinomadura sp. NBRC 104425]
MEVRSLPEALERIMKERGWTQCDLAQEIGKGQPWLSRVINGSRGTSLNTAMTVLQRVGWELAIRPKRDGKGEGSVKRREFHEKVTKVAGAAIAGKVSGVVLIPSEKVSPYQDLEYLRGLVEHLGTMYDQIGGNALVSTARRHAARIKAAMNSRDRQLQMAASDLARKASIILNNARHIKEANDVGIFSLALARRAGYSDGVAHCYENLCYFNAAEDPLQAAHYAKTGLQYPELTSEHRARLNARFGSAIVRVGNLDRKSAEFASRSAVDEARTVSELSTEAGAVVLGSSGNVLARLKRYDEADAAFEETLRLLHDRPMLLASWTWGRIYASLAGVRLSEAAAQMEDLARIVPMLSSTQLDKEIARIMTRSQQWADVPEIRAARDQLRSVMPTHPLKA